MSAKFDDPKFKLFIGDGFEYLKNHEDEYDVIITDSSDPVGPAESLFGQSFYELIHKALRANGILASQGKFRNVCASQYCDSLNGKVV